MVRKVVGGSKFKIGLTGGIASGKSTVADMFAELGIAVIDTDIIARQVVEPGQPALSELVEAFGPEVLDSTGALDRRKLRRIVFKDPQARARLEAIVHPRIRMEALSAMENAPGPYVVIVVPLLVETGFGAITDRVLVVDCPVAIQRSRLIERDTERPEQADRILAAQADRGARLAIADDIIDNQGSIKATRDAVQALHATYLDLAARASGSDSQGTR
jgi:dephospho-CoA kinase